MRIPAASCARVHGLVAAPRQEVSWLGACASALYVRTRSDDVVAVVARDAVWLPCALVVARRASELPLSRLVADLTAPVWLGDGRLDWIGPYGATAVISTGQWRPPSLPSGQPRPRALGRLAAAVRTIELGLPVDLGSAPVAVELLGRGPGLTPSGDDVLAGYLIGARAFGRPDEARARDAVRSATARTTALSAQLLRHAAHGDCAPALSRLVGACISGQDVDRAITDVLLIGSTSGAALATGLLIAANVVGTSPAVEVAA